ncbi:MAG TPA: alpha/beta fold hydrolase [Dehalococcoidia bacterium]|nr:alpha/beta fold hydrolase [Dehalococcoidia bacterium]
MIWTAAARPGAFPGAPGAYPAGPLQPALELAQLLRAPVFWGWGVPRGDGHTVLVLPGLGAGDAYLRPLRGWLRRLGYSTLRSGIARNPGLSERLIADLGEKVEAEYRRTGRRVSIVGHSIGGAQARAIARRHPEAVRQVITLGAPIAGSHPLPETIRIAAIASADDRIVRAPAAVARDPHAENLTVRGSHSGLAVNASVYRRLARLLTAAENARGGEAAPAYL